MRPATARLHRPGFLIYYVFEDAPALRRHPLLTATVRTATVLAVLALVTLLSLTLGPAFRS
ncbi:hypothetical protein GCM10010191_80870 [Actinomadura vinacea]|uniref:Uncharacterized protein n=1 Tax=Actinomadura vinacea TaxID=115336 RepID=A0ABN3KA22_9ACTN